MKNTSLALAYVRAGLRVQLVRIYSVHERVARELLLRVHAPKRAALALHYDEIVGV